MLLYKHNYGDFKEAVLAHFKLQPDLKLEATKQMHIKIRIPSSWYVGQDSNRASRTQITSLAVRKTLQFCLLLYFSEAM